MTPNQTNSEYDGPERRSTQRTPPPKVFTEEEIEFFLSDDCRAGNVISSYAGWIADRIKSSFAY